MPNNMSRLCFMMMAAVVAVFGVFAVSLTLPGVNAQAQDYSRAYRYGGGIHIPGAADVGSGVVQRDIVNVNAGIDVGGVLGCSGLDLKGMIKNTFEVGDLGAEFKDYLKNTLATEALSLLYSQPGVSQVLDGMKAIGHARASILQERCNANEILADVTNQRVKSEAYMECVDEHNATYCDDTDNLSEYVEDLMKSARWSGTLHDKICPEDEDGNRSASCDFIPNFAYNINDKEGKEYAPAMDADAVRERGRSVALECLQERGGKATELVNEEGYVGAQAMIGAGEAKIHCGEGGGVGGGDTENEGGDPVAGAMAGLSAAESCVLEKAAEEEGEPPTQINVEDLSKAIEQAQGMDLHQIIDAHTECIIGKELHAHVDLNIATAPAVEAMAAWNGLAEVFAVKAFINLNAMRIRKLSQAIINSGGQGSTKNCEKDDEGNLVPEGCVPSMTPQELDKASALLNQFRDEQQNALAELEMAERVAERIERMNRERDERKSRATGLARTTAQRGSSAATRSQQRTDYTDFFK